ncbi:kelch repeat-containing protein [Nitrosomonas sp. Nm166]|uniref:Kelch repeat-containing protein n=1 Tax=Nitrosomonas sp. Nm166 TaxID=1881054 RepID=UPI0008F3B7B5|nr:kelch repeat-containing protein [Nitrosomonas sp. Nm166]SFD86819.1 N-acetylneuraminic acid mutarotase [Nitrosomonas sp. Nm166]
MLISRLCMIAGILFFTSIHINLVLADTSKGTWATAASAPTQRTEVVAAAVENKIYVVGGFNKPNLQNVLKFAISNEVEVYDTTSDSWSVTTPLPEGRHHAGIASLNGLLYVIGGFTKSLMSVWEAVPTVYQYNPATKEWRELAPMPTARGALGVAVYQNRLYAIGGYDGKYNSGAVEIFDPQTNTWSSGAAMPTARDHLAVVAAGNRIYAIGGRPELDYRRNMGTVEEYDPQANQWRSRANLPTPRSGITAGVINDWIYVIGGESGEGTFATNEAYNPATDQWRTMAPMPTARHGLGSAVVNGRLYVISGGPTPGGSFSQVNEVFTPPPVE